MKIKIKNTKEISNTIYDENSPLISNEELKEKGYAQKIGISIYEPLELENINK